MNRSHFLLKLPLAALIGALGVGSVLAASQYEYRAPSKGLAVSATAGSGGAGGGTTPPAPTLTYLTDTTAQTLGFNLVRVGQSSQKTVSVLNTGTGALSLQTPSVSGAGFSATHNCGASLAAGASCEATVTFSPEVAGAATGTLSFASNATNSPSLVTLSGTGGQAVGALAAAAGSSADFGTVAAGSPSTKTFTFTNTGDMSAEGVYASVTGAGAVLSANTCGTSQSPVALAAGGSCQMSVTWTPQVGSNLTGSLVVTSNATNSPSSLALSGLVADAASANTVLMMPFDTDFSDLTGINVPVVGGGMAVSSGAGKYGNGMTVTSSSGGARITGGSQFQFGSGDFTVEGWYRPAASNSGAAVFQYGWGSYGPWLLYRPSGSNALNLYMSTGCGSWDLVGGNTVATLTPGTWYHIALSRTSNVIRVFVNGSKAFELSPGVKTLCVPSGTNDMVGIGTRPDNTGGAEGAYDEVRITKGLGRYTTNFTPEQLAPVAPVAPTSDPYAANVVAEMKFDTDLTERVNGLSATVVGSAARVTTGQRWGTGGMYTGNVGGLLYNANASMQMGSGDFTAEGWYNPNASSAGNGIFSHGWDGYGPWLLYRNGSAVQLYMSSSCTNWNLVGGNTVYSGLSAGGWYHLALVRSGSTVKVFVNGTMTWSTTIGTAALCVSGTDKLSIGMSAVAANPSTASGYYDEFRLTKGVARYSSSFIPTRNP